MAESYPMILNDTKTRDHHRGPKVRLKENPRNNNMADTPWPHPLPNYITIILLDIDVNNIDPSTAVY
jgi:hypothetical protein